LGGGKKSQAVLEIPLLRGLWYYLTKQEKGGKLESTAKLIKSSLKAGAPTVRQMLGVWAPLAATTVMMVLEPTIINVGLGRTTSPDLALAAYGVAFSLALLIEAPILMLLDASVARADDRAAFALIRRFALVLGLAVTSLGLVVSLTPLYDLIVGTLMDIPTDVAARARPTLQILSFWSLPIAWRRAHQGLLVRRGRTAVITAATAVRLTSLAGALFGGLSILPERGAVVAGIAMVISVVVEALLITRAAHPVVGAPEFGVRDPDSGPPLTIHDLWRFYRPLAVTTLMRQFARPLLTTGIAAALLARDSLAAWPVVWGLTILLAGPAWSLQQLTTALARDDTAYARVRRFALSLGGLFTLLLALVAFTPLYGWIMGVVYNLSVDLQRLGRPAVQLMAAYPLLMGAQSLLRGRLIREGCTGAVRTAMFWNVSALVLALVVGVTLVPLTGAVVAATATMVGALVELAWLRWRAAC
jgi:hypothetical protein